MAQMTQYSDLYAAMLQWLPGCDRGILLRALCDAARHICEVYEVWVEDLDPMAIVDYQQDYTLTSPYSNSFIHLIKQVKVNGTVYPAVNYELYQEDRLRFESDAVPHDLDTMLLTCGTAGSVTVADWQALTAASVVIPLGSDDYSLTGISFAGLTFDQIALAIQTALRAALDGNNGFCRWYTNKFKIWVESGTIDDYLSAGASGTDISGASWMNGLSGGTGVSLAGLLQVKVVLRPHQSVDAFPDWMLDRFSNALVARAIWILKNKPRPNPYRDVDGSGIWDTEFKIQLAKVISDKQKKFTKRSSNLSA
jgi:hypothetical protein